MWSAPTAFIARQCSSSLCTTQVQPRRQRSLTGQQPEERLARAGSNTMTRQASRQSIMMLIDAAEELHRSGSHGAASDTAATAGETCSSCKSVAGVACTAATGAAEELHRGGSHGAASQPPLQVCRLAANQRSVITEPLAQCNSCPEVLYLCSCCRWWLICCLPGRQGAAQRGTLCAASAAWRSLTPLQVKLPAHTRPCSFSALPSQVRAWLWDMSGSAASSWLAGKQLLYRRPLYKSVRCSGVYSAAPLPLAPYAVHTQDHGAVARRRFCKASVAVKCTVLRLCPLLNEPCTRRIMELPRADDFVPPPDLDLTVYGYNAKRLMEGLVAAGLDVQEPAPAAFPDAINIMNLHLGGDLEAEHGGVPCWRSMLVHLLLA